MNNVGYPNVLSYIYILLIIKQTIMTNKKQLTTNEKQLVETKLNDVLKSSPHPNHHSIIRSVLYGELDGNYNVIEDIDDDKLTLVEDYVNQLLNIK